MRKSLLQLSTVALLTVVLATALQAQNNEKLAQTGMKFLNVGASAQATGMGDALTSVEGSSLSMFYNPADMARLGSMVDVSAGYATWIADINHRFASVAFKPFDGDYGVLGFSFQSVDYGSLQATVRDNSTQAYQDVGTFSPSAMMVGIGYARAFSDRFSVGANVKMARQDLGTSILLVTDTWDPALTSHTVGNVVVFDFGMLYRTGFKSLNFGVSIRNFSREIRYERESFQLPLIFRLGISMDVLDLAESEKGDHSLLVSADATHPRDYPEQLNLGAQYTFMQILSLRAGYMFNNDDYGFTAGVGVKKSFGSTYIAVDYSYMPWKTFDPVNRVTVQFGL